ncbi:prostaglandin reductase 1-like [Ctenocephalides felis]|nr:prostaglandin reductase 1-like [Ctenocephalides felis]
MRAYMIRYPVGVTMIGAQVAKILVSRNPKFPVGRFVCGDFGWTTHTIMGQNKKEGMMTEPYLLPELGGISPSLCLGALGMPGNTAYFGFLEICQPKEGETVVVTGAAGAVGNHVGQLAKIKGCKVIGFAGSDEKCNWLKNDLGFDHALNYKTVDAAKALKEAAPNGVDCYFDNVGGELSSIIMNQMNLYGRISVCGAISAYNADVTKVPTAPIVQPTLIFKELKMEGFLVTRWISRWMEGIGKNAALIAEGKLKVRETVTDGFENTPQAFIDMLRGSNTGKAVVKCI